MPDSELASHFAAVHAIEVPPERRRTLSRYAWTAKGKRYLDQDGDNWVKGARLALRDDAYGDWTINTISDRAAQMLVDNIDPFEDLLAEVYVGGRVPKVAMSLVGSAINAGRKRLSA